MIHHVTTHARRPRRLRKRLLGSLLALVLGGSILTVPPARAESAAKAVDSNALADLLLGSYIRIADTDRVYAKHLVTSAEFLDWRAAHPQADQAALTAHLTTVQQAIDAAIPDRVQPGPEYEIAGTALGVLHTVPDATVDGPQVDRLLAALIARDTVPPTGLVSDRLGGALALSSWNESFDKTQSRIWAGVASTARADAGFDGAWNTAIGSGVGGGQDPAPARLAGGGVRASATVLELGNLPDLKQYFDPADFLRFQNEPEKLRLFTLDKMSATIGDTVQKRTAWFGDIKTAAPGPDQRPERLKKEEEGRKKIIDGAKTAFDGFAFFLDFAGSKDAARDLKKFASGALQIADAANKCITAFKLIDSAFSMATVAFTGNVISGIGTIVSLFAGAGPSIDQQILSAIGDLRKDIRNLHQDMQQRFDRVDQRLDTMYAHMMSQFQRLDGKLETIKTDIGDIARNLTAVEAGMQTIGANVTRSLSGLYQQPTWQSADTLIDYRRYHPGDQVTFEMYKQGEETFHLGGTETPRAPGAFVVAEPYDSAPGAVLTNLRDLGAGGSIRYLSWLANTWAPGFPVPDDRVGNPEMWKVAANAYTLLSAQNPTLAKIPNPPPNTPQGISWERPQHVMDAGKRILASTRKFSEPGPQGTTNALFTGLMNNYTAQLVALFNKAPDRERTVTENRYNLFGGPTQQVTNLPDQEGDPLVQRCGSSDPEQRLTRPNNMLGTQLPPAQMFARNVHPNPPRYDDCWLAVFGNEQTTSTEDFCEGPDHPVGCVKTVTTADLTIDFMQTLGWSGDMNRASRFAGDTIRRGIQVQYCQKTATGVGNYCTERPDPRALVLRDWQSGMHDQFQREATISIEPATEDMAKARMTEFLKQKQIDYYILTGNDIDKGLATELDLSVQLLRSYTELGFPRALQSDDRLRGLLYGKYALHANSTTTLPNSVLAQAFRNAAGNVADGVPPWQSDQYETNDGKPCERLPGLQSADPFVVCMAWSGKLRLDRLAERYAAQFKYRAEGSDQTLPDVQGQLRNLWLVTKTIYPEAKVGAPVDAPPLVQAQSLLNDAQELWKTEGTRAEAADRAMEAVAITRDFARQHPDARGRLAEAAIRPTVGYLAGTGRFDEANKLGDEAIALYKQLSAEKPTDDNLALQSAQSPLTVAQALWLKPQLHAKATTYALDAIAAIRPLAGRNPAYRRTLAEWAISPTVGYLAETGRFDEANKLGDEGIALYKQLSAEKPTDDNLALQSAQSSLTVAQALWRKPELHAKATTYALDAIAAIRPLAARNPAYRRTLAEWAISPTVGYLAETGRFVEANKLGKEAIDLFEGLAAEKPGDHELAFLAAQSLMTFGQALWLKPELRVKAAESAFDAVAALRRLVARAPQYRRTLAEWAISPTTGYLSAVGWYDDADKLGNEAVTLYRQLAAEKPADDELAFLAAQSSVIVAQAVWPEPDRRRKAATYALDAVTTLRPVATRNPAYRPQLGAWLLSPTIPYLVDTAQKPKAVPLAREAVDIYTALNQTDPAKYGPRLTEAEQVLADLTRT
ncbi:hypothetical protein [Embleya hyalina]|uniref:Uncharacterized protein n=1 Tax=Embleya hyalina TaxID=516124 RepID=A0A401Z4Z9_9ACTN|nr:hypothetical protein [Embleya hyalina]GCE01923.1 hypothetical protein EHYA_09698 [Embleya hyalina]